MQRVLASVRVPRLWDDLIRLIEILHSAALVEHVRPPHAHNLHRIGIEATGIHGRLAALIIDIGMKTADLLPLDACRVETVLARHRLLAVERLDDVV